MPIANPNDLPALVAACRTVLSSSGPIEVAEEYSYASLPLCVIDSVFSIGVRYESVRNVIERYCRRFGLPKQAPKGTVPPREQQESITTFLVRVDPMEPNRLAAEVFGNRQRTSARNGIVKANAVVQFAGVLGQHRIEHLQDVLEARGLSAVERDVRRIPGQSSGLSWRYFLMLAGREVLVKPDRMIFRFLERVVGRPVGPDEAQAMLTAAACELELEHESPGIEPRTLDNMTCRSERLRYPAASSAATTDASLAHVRAPASFVACPTEPLRYAAPSTSKSTSRGPPRIPRALALPPSGAPRRQRRPTGAIACPLSLCEDPLRGRERPR